MNPQFIDLLIVPEWIIPIVPESAVYTDCAVAIHGSDILAILPVEEALRRYSPAKRVDLPSQVLMPGLINAHGHAAMSLLRGYADDMPLQHWLQEKIWPTESRWVNEDFVRDGTELALAEMIRSGTTCFADMYFFPDQVAATARHYGLRSQVAFPVINFPSAWARDADEYIHKGLELHDAYRGDPLIKIAFGPHAPYTVDDKHLEKMSMLSGELEAPVHIHLHETAQEIADAGGERPIERMNRLGLLSPLTQAVHMTQLNDNDIALLSRTNAHVIHCPKSNLKLASGFCPVKKLQDNGINVALGTDGACSNNSLDMFSEMQFAALLAKGVSGNAAALDAHRALRMATLDGAKALGLDDCIGSIEAGKAADLIAVDLNQPESRPLYNPASQLVYTHCSSQVSHAWVNGKPLLHNNSVVTLPEQEVTAKARQWRKRIAGVEP